MTRSPDRPRSRSLPGGLWAGLVALLAGCAAAPGSGASEPPREEPAREVVETFDRLPPGSLTEARGPVGTLRTLAGTVRVDPARGVDAGPCLHLTGGASCVLELRLPPDPAGHGRLEFRAERWTAREPFELRVVQVLGDGRAEGDGPASTRTRDLSGAVEVGRVLRSHAVVDLDPACGAVRFEVRAPEGTGLLLDDLRLVGRGPRTLGRPEVRRPVVPWLLGAERTPVVHLHLPVRGDTGPLHLTALELRATGPDAACLRDVAVLEGTHHTTSASTSGAGTPLAVAPAMPGAPLRVPLGLPLEGSSMDLVVAGRVDPGIGLDARLDLEVVALELRDGHGARRVEIPATAPREPLRTAVLVRAPGDDGSRAFRIPGLVRTPRGTLVAVYDVRYDGPRDLPARIDVGVRRSRDGGRTWEAQRIVLSMARDGVPAGTHWPGGPEAPDLGPDGVGDPSLLVDPRTGELFVLATWSHGDRAWHGSGPGLSPDETGQLLLARSSDDGRTWGPPRNLTPEVKPPACSYLLQGPGRGIATSDGILVFPAQFQLAPEEGRVPHATVLWSEDGGATWTLGAGARPRTTESTVVELGDGEWMLNMRDDRGGARAVSTTRDRGRTWVEDPTSRRDLVEPVCNASLLHVGRSLGRGADGRLVFSNPAVPAGPRRDLALRTSHDAGRTWSEPLLLESRPSAGYSCLALADERHVGVLYEGPGGTLVFQRVPLDELFPAPLATGDGTDRDR